MSRKLLSAVSRYETRDGDPSIRVEVSEKRDLGDLTSGRVSIHLPVGKGPSKDVLAKE
jgi:hypothetical protein